jgi:anhydro-N-acetylmuramic acid kinase
MKTAIYHVIGVMSGTSLDGVDLCYVTFTKTQQWDFEIKNVETVPYTETWRERLKEAIHQEVDVLAQLDLDYTLLLGQMIKAFIQRYNIENITAVCSHGHTVFHQPENGMTKQIGNLEILAKVIKQNVVCDFRVQDVELGGQGAPLVPIGDRLLFSDYDYCVNLGGFANISFEDNSQRLAYDICPVNIVLNHYAERLGVSYDAGGNIARSGALNAELYDSLNALEFYKQSPPKSLGLEWVQSHVIPLLEKHGLKTEDILRTFLEHAAFQISKAIASEATAIFTGGGAFNTFLLERINTHNTINVVVPETTIVDYKEALIFGFLGVLKLRNEVNCLRSVTGALRDHSSGKKITIKIL